MQAAGCGDEDVGVAGLLDLHADRGAAVDDLDAQALDLGERPDVSRDLDRQLARRHENECARPGVRPGRALDDRHAEGERLAGSRRRLGENVEAGEGVREHKPLNGEWMSDPGCLERPNDGRADAELLEGL